MFANAHSGNNSGEGTQSQCRISFIQLFIKLPFSPFSHTSKWDTTSKRYLRPSHTPPLSQFRELCRSAHARTSGLPDDSPRHWSTGINHRGEPWWSAAAGTSSYAGGPTSADPSHFSPTTTKGFAFCRGWVGLKQCWQLQVDSGQAAGQTLSVRHVPHVTCGGRLSRPFARVQKAALVSRDCCPFFFFFLFFGAVPRRLPYCTWVLNKTNKLSEPWFWNPQNDSTQFFEIVSSLT